MGATEFFIDNFGKTVNEAYRKQVDHDFYEHGHGGYTGTLAEKDGFILITRPPRIRADRLKDLIIDAEQWMYWMDTDEKYRGQVYTEPKAKCRKAWYQLIEKYPAGGARNICKTYGEKWGPALAVEQSPAEKKARWNDLPRGSKTFLFFGMASC